MAAPLGHVPSIVRTLGAAMFVALLANACGVGQASHVRLGVVAPLTGPRAFIGQELANGAALAVESLNRDGGLLGQDVELVVIDDADLVNLPGQLSDLAELLNVTAIIGPESPGLLLGDRSPLSRRQVAALLPTAFSGDLDDAGTFVARIIPSARDQAEALGRWLLDVRGGRSVAILMADAVEGRDALDDLVEGFGAAGVDVAGVVEADAGAVVLDPSVASLRNRAPDADLVLFWGLPSAAARATLAARGLGWDVQLAVSASSFVAEYRTLIGDASEGVVLAFPYDDGWFNNPRMINLLVRYYSNFGLGALPQLETLVLDVPVLAIAAFDAVGLVGAAVEAAGSAVAADVAAALQTVTHDGILRSYHLDQREAWSADELYIARFHHLATVFDADGRLDARAQRDFWDSQVLADYLPGSLLGGDGGDAIQRMLDEGRRDLPMYAAPLPGPGPVATPESSARPRTGQDSQPEDETDAADG